MNSEHCDLPECGARADLLERSVRVLLQFTEETNLELVPDIQKLKTKTHTSMQHHITAI